MDETTAYLAGVVCGAATSIYPWVKFYFERRDKRIEQTGRIEEANKRAAVEAELAAIRRRAPNASPMIGVSVRRFNGVQIEALKPGTFVWYPAGGTQLLCFICEEVPEDLAAGTPVILVVENFGAVAYQISVTMKSEERVVIQELHSEGAEDLLAIVYPYHPELHGTFQALDVAFLRADGVRDVHQYHTRHGMRVLQRIDPD